MVDTEIDLNELAVKDATRLDRKVIHITAAMLGDGSDVKWGYFNPPIAVRLLSSGFNSSQDISQDYDDSHPGGFLWDTYYDAEVVNVDDLPEGFHVSWIDGPIYFGDGSVQTPSSWVEKLEDLI